MTYEASKIWVLVLKGRKIHLLPTKERSRRLLFRTNLKDRAKVIRIASQAGQMVCYHCQQPEHMRRDFPQRQGSQGFGTTQSKSAVGQERIQYILPHPSTGQRANISFRELHGHLLLHRQARGARLWVEAEDKAHRQGRQGFRGGSTPSHHRLSQQISQLYRVCFCYLAYGQECYLIMVFRIHLSLHQL